MKTSRINKKGFSLAEVMISTIVMTMILFSVISFIKSGSDLWRKGQAKISAENYKRAVFEVLKNDLRQATIIHDPIASSTAQLVESAIVFTMNTSFGNRKFRIATDANATLKREIDSVIPAEMEAYNIRIARNVASFSACRISTWTIQIFLEVGTDPNDYGDREMVSSDTVVFTAPRAG